MLVLILIPPKVKSIKGTFITHSISIIHSFVSESPTTRQEKKKTLSIVLQSHDCVSFYHLLNGYRGCLISQNSRRDSKINTIVVLNYRCYFFNRRCRTGYRGSRASTIKKHPFKFGRSHTKTCHWTHHVSKAVWEKLPVAKISERGDLGSFWRDQY